MNEFIYNQHDIPKERYRYGLRASADVGCGWVATWNALQILGYKTDIPALIRYYEWQLPLITAIPAPPSGGLLCASGNGASR